MSTNDIFNPDIKLEKQENNQPKDPVEMRSQMKLNFFIILAYIAISFLGSIVINTVLTQLNERYIDQFDTTDIEWRLAYDEESETHRIYMNGEIINQNDRKFQAIVYQFTFVEDEETIAQFRIRFIDILANETRSFEHDFAILDYDGAITEDQIFVLESNQIENSISVNNTGSLIFQVSVSLVTGILLVILNRKQYVNDFKIFKKTPKDFLKQIFIGFLIVWIALIVSQLILAAIGITDTSQNEEAIQQMFSGRVLDTILLFVSLTILAPIVEETVFRKGIYGLIEPYFSAVPAIIISGVVFGFMHVAGWGDFIQIIPYAFMGIAFGYIYYKSGKNIYVVIAVHFLNNLIPFLMYAFF